MGVVFVFLSNYFNVLSPQITGFVIDFVQQLFPGYTPPKNPPKYDTLVNEIAGWLKGSGYTWVKVVALCGITILILALLRGFFLFLMRQTIIVMSRHIEYDQKDEIYNHYQQLDTAFYKFKLFIFTFTLPLDIVHFRSPLNSILSIKVTIIRHNKVLRWRSMGAGSTGNIRAPAGVGTWLR